MSEEKERVVTVANDQACGNAKANKWTVIYLDEAPLNLIQKRFSKSGRKNVVTLFPSYIVDPE